jgi:hypothetical protein
MKATLTIVFFLLVLGLFVSFLFPAMGPGISYAPKAAAKNAVIQLAIAAKAYKQEYGEPPKGDNRSILRTLQDDNPRKIVFIELNPKEISKDGFFLDPWGTPYAFDLSNAAEPWAYSFGKNKIDEGGHNDDVTSW